MTFKAWSLKFRQFWIDLAKKKLVLLAKFPEKFKLKKKRSLAKSVVDFPASKNLWHVDLITACPKG